MNILLVRTDAIGDVILTLPVATALKRYTKKTKVVYLVSQYASPVLENHPDVDELIALSGNERFKDLVRIFKKGFDAVVFLKPFKRLILASYVARIPMRIGTGYRWYSIFLNKRVYEHRKTFSKHESEYNLGMLKAFGITTRLTSLSRLYLTQEERRWADGVLARVPMPRIIIHPGILTCPNWPIQRYFSLAERLLKLNVSIILTGSEKEALQFRNFLPENLNTSSKVLNLMGQLTLRQLIAIVSHSDLVVSGATGPMHIAASLGISTLSFFDPRRGSSHVRWGPLGGKGFIFKPDVSTCEKWHCQRCPHYNCMNRISLEDVFSKIVQIFSGDGVITEERTRISYCA